MSTCHFDVAGKSASQSVTLAFGHLITTHAPVLHDYSLNLSILLSDGSENNYDSSSNGERTTILLHTAALSAGHLWAHLCDGYGKGLLKGSLPCGAIEGESPVPVLVTLTRPFNQGHGYDKAH